MSNLLSRPQKHLQKSFWPMVALMALIYFAFYTLYGTRGYYTLKDLEQDLSAKSTAYEAIQNQRQDLEHQVRLMRPDSVDPDMMTEQIRKNLYYIHPNDIVIKVQ